MRTSMSVLEPNYSLILANFAQFLYLAQNGYDRFQNYPTEEIKYKA